MNGLHILDVVIIIHSVVSDSVPPWSAACQPSLSFTISWSLLKLMPIESVMPSNHLILSHPLLLLPSIFPSIKVFSNESVLHIRWPKYWSFRFSISPSSECSGLISYRIDCFNLLAVQRNLKSLLQHHSSKASNWYFERHHDTLNKNQVFSSTTVWRHHMILWNKNHVWYFLSNDLMMVICHT